MAEPDVPPIPEFPLPGTAAATAALKQPTAPVPIPKATAPIPAPAPLPTPLSPRVESLVPPEPAGEVELEGLVDAPWLQQTPVQPLPPAPAFNEPPAPQKSFRLASLDIYRGFVMFLMAAEILELSKVAAKTAGTSMGEFWAFLAKQQTHVEWAGSVLHDMIQPSFSFMVGTAMAFSMANRDASGQSSLKQWTHAIIRSLVLILLGVFLRSMDAEQTYWTFEDTLTQIGLGYPILFALGRGSRGMSWAALIVILLGYWSLFVYWPMPIGPDSWPDQYKGFFAHWNLNANPAWAFDTWFLNLFPREHMFTGNDGGYCTLNFIPTLGTMILGLIAGRWLRQATLPGESKPTESSPRAMAFGKLIVAGAITLALGWAAEYYGICPVVKKIWTPAWVLLSGGWCFLLMAGFYLLADLWHLKKLFFPFTVIGVNSIAMYVLAHTVVGFFGKALHTHFGEKPFLALGEAYQPLLHGGAILLILWLILYWMYRQKFFVRI